MSVSVIAKIDQAYMRPADNATSPDDHYMVVVNYSATDGTTAVSGDAFAISPMSWGARRADRYLRERIAAQVLASYSLTIDPEDIYIPLS